MIDLSTAKPILFNTEMVRAILDGRKTVTRRAMKNPPPNVPTVKFSKIFQGMARFEWECSTALCDRKLIYDVGNILYVRETFCYRWLPDGFFAGDNKFGYKADGVPSYGYWGIDRGFKPSRLNTWIPSIHMPKEAARIFLRVTNVKVEKLQDITGKQAIKEGEVPNIYLDGSFDEKSTITSFIGTWNSTIKKSDINCYGWNANPWVFVYDFERVDN